MLRCVVIKEKIAALLGGSWVNSSPLKISGVDRVHTWSVLPLPWGEGRKEGCVFVSCTDLRLQYSAKDWNVARTDLYLFTCAGAM